MSTSQTTFLRENPGRMFLTPAAWGCDGCGMLGISTSSPSCSVRTSTWWPRALRNSSTLRTASGVPRPERMGAVPARESSRRAPPMASRCSGSAASHPRSRLPGARPSSRGPLLPSAPRRNRIGRGSGGGPEPYPPEERRPPDVIAISSRTARRDSLFEARRAGLIPVHVAHPAVRQRSAGAPTAATTRSTALLRHPACGGVLDTFDRKHTTSGRRPAPWSTDPGPLRQAVRSAGLEPGLERQPPHWQSTTSLASSSSPGQASRTPEAASLSRAASAPRSGPARGRTRSPAVSCRPGGPGR